NIMVGEFGEVQVMDWGLARVLPAASVSRDEQGSATTLRSASRLNEESEQTDHTQAGTILGTPAYMAPEQARGEIDRIGPPSDVFALGGILAEILTGSPAFRGKSTRECIERAAAADLADAFARLAACGADAELVALCRRCLSPEPADRPADGKAVAAAVAGYRAGVEQRLRRAEQARAAAEVKVVEQRKRRRVQLALVGAVMLFLL